MALQDGPTVESEAKPHRRGELNDNAHEQPPSSQAGGRSWQLHVDGVSLLIERLTDGRWNVLYGGYSRASASRLSDAVAIATAANVLEPWVRELAESVEDDEAATHPEPEAN